MNREASPLAVLSNSTWELIARPASGGHVVSLWHRPSGQEILAQTDRASPAPAPELWIDGATRGWEECFPNIGIGPNPNSEKTLQDHGELWRSVPKAAFAQHTFAATWTSASIPSRFEREIRLVGDRVEASYTITNLGEMTSAVSWAMHLLLNAPPSAVMLSEDVPVRVDSAQACFEDWKDGSWSEAGAHVPPDEGIWCAKLFTAPGSARRVTVRFDPGILEVLFDPPSRRGSFGIWLNAGALAGRPSLRHVGIEPGFGDHDQLSSSAKSNSALVLAPGETYQFNVSLRLIADKP